MYLITAAAPLTTTCIRIIFFMFMCLSCMGSMEEQQTQSQQQQQHKRIEHSNVIMNGADVTEAQLLVPMIGMPDNHLTAQDGKYDAPDDCHFLPAHGSLNHEIMLTCNLRTVNSEFDTTNFSVIPSEHTVGLHILCNDEIMAKSSLEPQSFAHLVRLQELSIQYCKLSKFNQHVLDGLSQLKNLTVRTHNTLWPSLNFDIEPNAFETTKNVERLDLSSNNIWSLPDNMFCNLSALYFLNVSENRLQDVSELGFRNRGGEAHADISTISTTTNKRSIHHCHLDLEILDVSFNHFVLLPANGFGTLRRLRVLHVNNNEISMIADKALSGLKSLHIINLSSNKIVALPSELFSEQSSSIQEVYLQNNSISVLSPKLFSNLEQLQTLDLSYNQITSTWIDRNTFVGLIRLVLLNLSHNKLSKLEPEIFVDLYTLQILNLRYNKLETIAAESFAPMNNLHTLLLSHNRLKYLDAHALNGLFVLSLLSLDNNNLIGVHPEALRNCSSLQDLNLNGNQLKSVPLALRNMRLLRTVDLGENMISVLEDTAFKGLSNLYGLRLIGNYLENITMNAFKALPNLQILNLARNRIATVQPGAFEMIPSLQAIRLDGNDLADINGLFNNIPSLLWLNISDNRLEYFDYAHLPQSLQWLDLHKNRLSELSNRFGLDSQIHLQTLDGSFNQIQSISPSSIPNSIELLFLNDNLVSRIDADTFMHKINLTRVDLYANQITTLDIKSLRILPIDDHRPLPEFYIGGNPFTCDCSIDWLQKINHLETRQYPRIMDLETIYCKLLNNRNRAYIPLVEAEPKHFLCTYTTHCFTVCHCCEFDACDCEMTCPTNCTCFHDQTWSTNIVECSKAGYTEMPRKVPMDTTELYIDGNNFVELASHSFLGRKNLAVLYINNSNVQHIHNTTFSGLRRLQVLHLEHNQINTLFGSEFSNLENLRELYLQYNHISSISERTFRTLRKLEVLRLDGNRLVYFEVWQLALNPYLVDIALANNQWSCECNYLTHFRTYLAQHSGKITDAAQVSCVYNNATSVLHERNGTKCTLREDVATYMQANEIESLLPLLLMATLASVGFFALVFSLFCYRQELQLWLHTNCLFSICYKSSGFVEGEPDKERSNDAYFAYSLQDDHFVNQILTRTLESDMGYRICLHYRDIDINAYITDAIIEAAESAKQFVLVLSKNFLYNEWSRFEFRNALHEIIKRRKRLIFILYGDIPQRDIDSDMRHYLRISSCIEWDDKKFWQKLRIALPYRRTKRRTNCLSGRNIYATSQDYQTAANGRLSSGAGAVVLTDKNYADCNNYATINECVRGYAPIPATASNFKFNTLTDLPFKPAIKVNKDAHHAKTLDLQQRHHNHAAVQPHNNHQQQQHHEYAVPSYYSLGNGQVSRGVSINVTNAPAYDTIDYKKQNTLKKKTSNVKPKTCDCSHENTISKRAKPMMHTSFSSNFTSTPTPPTPTPPPPPLPPSAITGQTNVSDIRQSSCVCHKASLDDQNSCRCQITTKSDNSSALDTVQQLKQHPSNVSLVEINATAVSSKVDNADHANQWA